MADAPIEPPDASSTGESSLDATQLVTTLDVGRERRAAHAEQRRLTRVATGDWRAIRGFSMSQRRALILLGSIFLVCVAVGLLRNPTHVDDPLPPDAARFGLLVDRVDPNRVDAGTLSALPGLGDSKAAAIVAYRNRMRAVDPNRVVFQTVDDLMRVDGIGYAISRQIEPFLSFPTSASTEIAP